MTVFYLTGKTTSRKKNGLRRSNSQLAIPGGDDQVFTSEVTETHTQTTVHHKMPIILITQGKHLVGFQGHKLCIVDSLHI